MTVTPSMFIAQGLFLPGAGAVGQPPAHPARGVGNFASDVSYQTVTNRFVAMTDYRNLASDNE